jgi:hypothetical protein
MAAGMAGCNFVRINGDDLAWGLIWRQETEMEDELTSRKIQCTSFDALQTDRFDAPWKFGMACALLAIITVAIASLSALALSCATYSRIWKNVLSAGFVVGSILQVLTFCVLASDICQDDDDCTLSFGAGITIGGIALALLAGATTFILTPFDPAGKHAAVPRAPFIKVPVEDHHENADEATESETHGANADLEAPADHGNDDMQDKEYHFVPDEQEETPVKDENEEHNPFADDDDFEEDFDSVNPSIETDIDENFSDVPLTEEDVEAIIDEARDESGVEYDNAKDAKEGLAGKKLPEI